MACKGSLLFVCGIAALSVVVGFQCPKGSKCDNPNDIGLSVLQQKTFKSKTKSPSQESANEWEGSQENDMPAKTEDALTENTPLRTRCPALYHPIKEDLDEEGKQFEKDDKNRRIQQCADVCSNRRGCTGFEYANGPVHHGLCVTYTGGRKNIMKDEGRLSANVNWYSCMADKTICPFGYYPIKENLDGEGKQFEKDDKTRSIQQCADVCNNRRECTGFEYANGPVHHGLCVTYTAGSKNIRKDEGRLSRNVNWYSCMSFKGRGNQEVFDVKKIAENDLFGEAYRNCGSTLGEAILLGSDQIDGGLFAVQTTMDIVHMTNPVLGFVMATSWGLFSTLLSDEKSEMHVMYDKIMEQVNLVIDENDMRNEIKEISKKLQVITRYMPSVTHEPDHSKYTLFSVMVHELGLDLCQSRHHANPRWAMKMLPVLWEVEKLDVAALQQLRAMEGKSKEDIQAEVVKLVKTDAHSYNTAWQAMFGPALRGLQQHVVAILGWRDDFEDYDEEKQFSAWKDSDRSVKRRTCYANRIVKSHKYGGIDANQKMKCKYGAVTCKTHKDFSSWNGKWEKASFKYCKKRCSTEFTHKFLCEETKAVQFFHEFVKPRYEALYQQHQDFVFAIQS